MRLSSFHIQLIHQETRALLGDGARIILFGSRVNEKNHGGDVDLLVEMAFPIEEPVLIAARLASRISRAMQGRKVDVLLQAPNLPYLPIHEIAQEEGILL
jgi:predicted nucleotidyltransferase